MELLKQPVRMSVLAFLISHGVLAACIILGFTVDVMIPVGVIPAMLAFGLFKAWRSK